MLQYVIQTLVPSRKFLSINRRICITIFSKIIRPEFEKPSRGAIDDAFCEKDSRTVHVPCNESTTGPVQYQYNGFLRN